MYFVRNPGPSRPTTGPDQERTFAMIPSVPSAQCQAPRTRRSNAACALLESLEPRLLLTGSYIPAYLEGPWNLAGLTKSGYFTFDDVSQITAGQWTSQDGATSQIITGTGSAFTLDITGAVGLTLQSALPGATISANTAATGIISATRDVVALTETLDGTPIVGGLDLLVNHAGAFTIADFMGTWTIAGADFRGTVTLDAFGHVTGGSLTREANQHTAAITAGTATLNANGTGTLALSTRFSGADSDLATVALDITMNAAKDVVVANNANIGQPAVPAGTGPAHLTLLVKSAGIYGRADVAGVTWTLAGALGAGTLTLSSGGNISGTLHGTDGFTWALSGSYTMGSTGTIATGLNAAHGGTVNHYTLTGAMNGARNLLALDRTVANSATDSSLMVLISPANHRPTELPVALWPQIAYHASNITVDYSGLVTVTGAKDVDRDPLTFLITAVPTSSGMMTLTHGPLTTTVVPGATVMVAGDTLSWSPSASAVGLVDAFSVQASDGTISAANATQININTRPIAVVSAKATVATALESRAGTSTGDGKIQIQRSGGDQTRPLTVTLDIAGTAGQGVNYRLLAPDGVTVLTGDSPVVVIPAGKSGVQLTVAPVDDQGVDPTLSVLVTVAPDPNATSSAYAPALHRTAEVDVIDGSPRVTIAPGARAITEGVGGVNAFILTRAPAPGGRLAGTLTVGLTYAGTFDTASHLTAPAAITFLAGETRKVVTLSTTDNHIADPTQTLIATVGGTGFFATGTGSATVNVLDASPVVSIAPINSTALEAHPSTNPGRFTIRRTGSTTDAMTVDFTTSSGGTFGTLGTNYVLTDASGNALTNSVIIPVGRSGIIVTLTPLDDGANDPTLRATLTLEPDATPTYHVGTPGQVTIAIRNNDRPPTVALPTTILGTTFNTALTLGYDQLVTLMGAALAPGETHGVLQFKVTAALAGTLQIRYAGGTAAVMAPVGTLFSPGDTLIWTPPLNAFLAVYDAFSLTAQDGTLAAAVSTRFRIAVA
jgi:hypothetical protein